jgi:hypothetical protein
MRTGKISFHLCVSFSLHGHFFSQRQAVSFFSISLLSFSQEIIAQMFSVTDFHSQLIIHSELQVQISWFSASQLFRAKTASLLGDSSN